MLSSCLFVQYKEYVCVRHGGLGQDILRVSFLSVVAIQGQHHLTWQWACQEKSNINCEIEVLVFLQYVFQWNQKSRFISDHLVLELVPPLVAGNLPPMSHCVCGSANKMKGKRKMKILWGKPTAYLFTALIFYLICVFLV